MLSLPQITGVVPRRPVESWESEKLEMENGWPRWQIFQLFIWKYKERLRPSRISVSGIFQISQNISVWSTLEGSALSLSLLFLSQIASHFCLARNNEGLIWQNVFLLTQDTLLHTHFYRSLPLLNGLTKLPTIAAWYQRCLWGRTTSLPNSYPLLNR